MIIQFLTLAEDGIRIFILHPLYEDCLGWLIIQEIIFLRYPEHFNKPDVDIP